MIYWIQNTASVAEGCFIYLRQNPDNDKNPYDLVPFRFGENKREGRQSQTPRGAGSRSHERNPVTDRDEAAPRDQNRASQNLKVIENYENRGTRQDAVARSRKVFKS